MNWAKATVCALLVVGNAYGAGKITRYEATTRVGTFPRSDGRLFASLYALGGHTLVFKDNGDPLLFGAGYIQALPGQNWTASSDVSNGGPAGGGQFFEGQICGLDMKRVEWDDKGRTTSISGLGPSLETSGKEKKIKITSDTAHPKIVDGNLYIKLDRRGDSEYWIKMLFGNIVGVGQHSPAQTARSTNDGQEFRELNYVVFPPVIGTKTDGFRLVAVIKGERYTERGTLSGELEKLWLIPVKRAKAFDLEWADGKVLDGRVATKLFGTLMVDWKWADKTWLLLATDAQAKRMQQWIAGH